MNDVTLITIEQSCTKLATARSVLNAKLIALQSEMDAVRRNHLQSIRKALAKVEQLTTDTRDLVASAPELFDKPKTQTLAGIKVGYQQGKSRLDIPDVDETLLRIQRLLPATADMYIKTEESPIRATLAQLPAAMQKRLGVKVIEGEDEVLVKPQDSEVEALCKTLLGGG
jgi:outer membrane murein-binding lipoprotein Lpp